MGTALFAADKISLLKSIQNLEQSLAKATDQQYALTNQAQALSEQSQNMSIYSAQAQDVNQQAYYKQEQLNIDATILNLQQEEKKLQSLMRQMETQLTMKTQEYQSVTQAEGGAIKRGSPHYNGTA